MLLSVIIPTRNRSCRLADLLDSLAQQEPIPFDWEVIVVDNGSTDDTRDVVKQKSAILPIDVRYVLEPSPGLHHGRHRGTKETRGKLLAFLDDDVTVDSTWIKGVDLLQSGAADAVVSRILPKWEAELPEWLPVVCTITDGCYVSGYYTLLDLGNKLQQIAGGFIFGASFFIRKQIVFELGGFHPDAMPDDLLRYRGNGEGGLMEKFDWAGLKGYYEPRSVVYHAVSRERLTVEYLCKRAYKEGISDSYTQIRAARRGDIPCPQPQEVRRDALYYIRRCREMSLAQLVQAVCRRFIRPSHRARGNSAPLAFAEIRKQIDEARHAGWQFHQNEVKKDPKLFEWVLRENYLGENGKLP